MVSLEVPRTFHELAGVDAGLPRLRVCFTLLIVIWREHYVFFRRYGLQDTATIWLNAALLFVMLFYVYPLKFRLHRPRALRPDRRVAEAGRRLEPAIEPAQVPTLFVIYGAGVIALYLLLALHVRARLPQRGELELTPVETFDTKASIVGHLLAAGIGLVSIVLAVTRPAAARRPRGVRLLPLRARDGGPRRRSPGTPPAPALRGGAAMSRFLWICLGGRRRDRARATCSRAGRLAALGAGFPYGTLAVNVLGSFCVGFLMQVGIATPLLSPTLRMALTTGVMGGFTTYSTFNYETIRYVQDGAWRLALGNVARHAVVCLAAGFAGLALGRSLFGG